MEEKEQLQLMRDTIDDIRPMVKDIESNTMSLTKGHYGAYLTMLSLPDCPNENAATFLAACLICAGANRQGVLNALAIAYPNTRRYLDKTV
tara:strand:- start:37 stop:309 length:273 start_codon:yes stop_codon:yes gene_type:complete